MNDELPNESNAEALPEQPAAADHGASPGADASPYLDELGETAKRMSSVRSEIAKALLGQQEIIDQALVAVLASGHVLLEGVPGMGKTLLVLALGRVTGCKFARIQFTPDLMPSDVTGHVMYDMESGRFHLRKGPAFTQLLLADEINRAPAKTQSSLLEVMQEGQITIEGESTQLEPPFVVFATQNPIEQEGTYPLPEAQLDRFLFKVIINPPDEAGELAIVQHVIEDRAGSGFRLDDLRQVVTPEDLVRAQKSVSLVRVEESVASYAVRIVRATRESRGLSLGSGPRGAIALVRAARALALLEGRAYVEPDDVKRMALPCLRHRVAPAPELQLEGRSADEALESILAGVEAPRR
tara:strand:+ start:3012 stop:4076 length:1065 start_codon:yes stop_codon:yes gene_type:complete